MSLVNKNKKVSHQKKRVSHHSGPFSAVPSYFAIVKKIKGHSYWYYRLKLGKKVLEERSLKSSEGKALKVTLNREGRPIKSRDVLRAIERMAKALDISQYEHVQSDKKKKNQHSSVMEFVKTFSSQFALFKRDGEKRNRPSWGRANFATANFERLEKYKGSDLEWDDFKDADFLKEYKENHSNTIGAWNEWKDSISPFLTKMYDDNLIPSNPMRKIGFVSNPKKSDNKSFIPVNDISDFLKFLKIKCEEYHNQDHYSEHLAKILPYWVATNIYTGVRPEYSCGLRGDFFKWDKKGQMPYGYLKTKPYMVDGGMITTKTGNTRTIPISAKLRKILFDDFMKGEPKEGFLWPNKKDAPYTYAPKLLGNLLKGSKWFWVTWEVFRHTFITNTILNSVGKDGKPPSLAKIYKLMRVFGHTNLKTTMGYVHMLDLDVELNEF